MNASVARSLARELRVAAATGLVWGGLLGVVAAVAFLVLPASGLILRDFASRAHWLGLMAGGAALVGCGTAAALAGVVTWLSTRGSSRFGPGSPLLYAMLLSSGATAVLLELLLVFRVFRDPRGPSALAGYAAVAAAALLAGWLATRLRRRPASRAGPARPRLAALGLVVAAVAGLVLFDYRSLTRYAAGGVVTAARLPFGEGAAEAPPVNLILVSIDTLRADHVSGFAPTDTAVHLRRLQGLGTAFLHAESQAPWTLPSHATMLTSLYPSTHGARFSSQHADIIDALDDAHLTLAEVLAAHGMHTAAFTNAHWFEGRWNLLQGFETRENTEGHAGSAPVVLGKARDWLERSDRRPFFLFVHLFDVHEYAATGQGRAGSTTPDRPGLRDRVARNTFASIPAEDLAYLRERYDRAIRYVDAALGQFFDWLEHRGLLADSIVVVTSDHGEEFWDHRGTGHGFTLYEEQLHVPLIIKPAAGSEGLRPVVFARVGVIDIVPTVLELMGLALPERLEGRSLLAAMRGRPFPDRALFAEDTYFLNSYAVFEGNLKYVRNDIPPCDLFRPALAFVNLRSLFRMRGPELYDLGEDPRESRNLAGSRPVRVRRLRDRLLAHVRLENTGVQALMDQATHDRLRALGYAE